MGIFDSSGVSEIRLRCPPLYYVPGARRVITLSGSVPSYYLKQVAQRLALNAVESTAVMANQLTVES